MIGKTNVIIDGFKFEKIDGKRTIQSVFLLDIERGNCVEVPVSSDTDLDKEKLAKKLLDYFRKDAVVFIDIQNIPDKTYNNSVDVRFVGIKDS